MQHSSQQQLPLVLWQRMCFCTLHGFFKCFSAVLQKVSIRFPCSTFYVSALVCVCCIFGKFPFSYLNSCHSCIWQKSFSIYWLCNAYPASQIYVCSSEQHEKRLKEGNFKSRLGVIKIFKNYYFSNNEFKPVADSDFDYGGSYMKKNYVIFIRDIS